MRVLVTGAAGFVGRHLVAHLRDCGHEVVACTLEAPPPGEPGLRWEVMDLTDPVVVAGCVGRFRPEGVVHLAAQASPGGSWDDPQGTYRTNIEGTANLLESLTSTGPRTLLVGSAQQYARSGDSRPLVETDRQEPDSPYALTKIAQEQMGRLYRLHHDLPVVCTRSFNHTGPGQSPRYAVGAFCSQIARLEKQGGGRMRVGNLEARRDLSDVRDVVRAYLVLLERGRVGEAYNVCSGRAVRMGSVLDKLLAVAGLADRVQVEHGEATAAGPDLLVGDPAKIHQDVGWRPQIPLDRSLVETLDWYRANLEDEG